ncbi:MAG: hypothetical protein HY301_17700 [Verrucomicrobia bacterium]|nr:hypothetical protein [Verrucomicrobiota bacterium]
MQLPNRSAAACSGRILAGTIVFIGGLALLLAWMYHRSFEAGILHFANDAPIGTVIAEQLRLPGGFSGYWFDLNWIGQAAGFSPPSINTALQMGLGPIGYAKFLPPAVSFILGLCAWLFFRQSGHSHAVSGLAGLAAALNMNFMSNACWGLGVRSLTLAEIFLAMAALSSPAIRSWWIKALLAGAAIGLAVTEGFDVGAIYSLYVAAFAVYLVVLDGEGAVAKRFAKGAAVVAVMAVFSAVIAVQVIETLVGTSLKGITELREQQMNPQERYDWATQWSLCKAETFRVLVPGIYGYRLDATGQGWRGGDYWGRVGQQPNWEQHHGGFPRHSGSGEYAGLFVVLVAIYAFAQSRARGQTAFNDRDRKIILFWSIAAAISLPLAWGRFAPFYQAFYALPFFNTIRNPMKFMHPFHMAVMILFAYGLKGLWKLYVDRAATSGAGTMERLQKWWASLAGFERKWSFACGGAFILSVLAWLIYSSAKPALMENIKRAGMPPELAPDIAAFSIREVGLAVFVLALSLFLLALIMSGAFAGARKRWAVVFVGVFVAADLWRADAHWIVHYDYAAKYATNPVIDFLREKPYENRVTALRFNFPQPYPTFMQVYDIEWMQHHFPFYNVQSIDVVQMPREPADYAAYRGMRAGAFSMTNLAVQTRYWQLTSTRYIFGIGQPGFTEGFNQQFDPEKRRFKHKMLYTLVQEPTGFIGAVTTTNGPLSLMEFTGALPRAKLFANWQTNTDDKAVLKTLADPAFDPEKTVIIDSSKLAPPSAENANRFAGTVEFVSYAPKRISLKAKVEVPAVLLHNDKYDPNWKVWVDGKPAELLRANFIMRGVALTPGEHKIEIRYKPVVQTLYVSLAGIIAALGLCAFVVLKARAARPATSEPTAPPPNPTPPATPPPGPGKGRKK